MPPAIPDHAFFDPFLGYEVAQCINEDALKLLFTIQKPNPDLEKMVQLLLFLIGKKKNQTGDFEKLKGGLHPIDYVDNGFYHFGGAYNILDQKEFDEMCMFLKEKANKK